MSETDYHQVVEIKAHQAIPGRDFTHPAYIPFDERILKYMLLRVSKLVTKSFKTSIPDVVEEREFDGRNHRLMLLNRRALLDETPLSLVGFFGHKRPQADPLPMVKMDKALREELKTHAGILSYSSMELTCGNYANCVILKDEEAKLHWARSQNHKQTAEIDAPSYYYSVRIYNGRLPFGLPQSERLQLNVIKYYHYERQPVWQAVRSLE
ncbi:MAG: hypothetical protein AAF633_20520 [Chloroflexota bacterium]